MQAYLIWILNSIKHINRELKQRIKWNIFHVTYPGLDRVIILLLLPPTIEHMRGGRVVTMLRALFLSSLPLLRARWVRPTIQAAPVFPFPFHSIITIHHYGHRDDQGQTGTSCRTEDRRGNHLSPRSSLSFPTSFPLCELSPRVSLSTLSTLKNVVSIRSEERKFRRKDWLDCARCCATFPSLLFFLEIRMTLLVEKFGVIYLFKVFLWDEWEYVSLVICAIYSRERRLVCSFWGNYSFLVSNNIW